MFVKFAKEELKGIQGKNYSPKGDAVVTGVYMHSGEADNTYISWGLFEDLILNPEFGFGDNLEDILHGENFNIRFDSSESFTRTKINWNSTLQNR